jgi:hypothetical protein
VISSSGSSGGGSINFNDGVYTAPDGAATVEIAVADSAGSIADASIIVATSNLQLVAPIASPVPSPTVAVNSTIEFQATGGEPPYTFAVASGTGTIAADPSNSTGAIFSSTSVSDVSEISVTDSIGATTYKLITVGTGNSGGSVTPTPSTVPSFTSITVGGVASNTVVASATLSMNASGGTAPYTYGIYSGSGSINSSTGVFTAPTANGVTEVQATDASGFVGYQAVTTINGTAASTSLAISPGATTVGTSASITFTASGGTAPYTFSLVSGSGSINSSTGIYTSSTTTGVVVIQVKDNVNATSQAHVRVESTQVTLTSNTSEPQLITDAAPCYITSNTSVYSSAQPTAPPYLTGNFSVLTSISQVNLLTYDSSDDWFPTGFEIYVTDEYDSSWIFVGAYTTGASNALLTNHIVSVELVQTYNTWGVLVVASTLKYSSSKYEFGLCKMSAQ